MGCVSGRECDGDEQPVHAVTIARPFALSKYEVTFEEYDRFTYPNRVADAGWGRGRRPVMTAPVGSFGANAWGLHDMHGNVSEWVQDCWHGNYTGAPGDGSAWTSGGDCSRRVLRGGSWLLYPWYLRSANRVPAVAGYRFLTDGFRVARTLD